VFLGCWNDFFWPLIILTDQSNYTLPVALAAMARDQGPSVELLMAGAVLTMAPPLILFVLLQGYVMRILPPKRRRSGASKLRGSFR
jgi:multiple sugar transport system permease protein